MRISCTCEKCNIVSLGDEDDAFVEFDFSEKCIRFYCRNKKCKHVNEFSFSKWRDEQKKSPLPKMRMA